MLLPPSRCEGTRAVCSGRERQNLFQHHISLGPGRQSDRIQGLSHCGEPAKLGGDSCEWANAGGHRNTGNTLQPDREGWQAIWPVGLSFPTPCLNPLKSAKPLVDLWMPFKPWFLFPSRFIGNMGRSMGLPLAQTLPSATSDQVRKRYIHGYPSLAPAP